MRILYLGGLIPAVLLLTAAAPGAQKSALVPECPPEQCLPTEAEIAAVKVERKLWEGNTLGAIEDVPPPPWTPMVTDGARVGCYGREYDFTASLFPRQISNQACAMLARPMALELQLNGREIAISSAVVTVAEQDSLHALVRARADGDEVAVEVRSQIEFDGMVRLNLRLIPQKPELTLDGLCFEIPLRKERSLLYNWKGASMDPAVSNAGRVPSAGLQGGFHGMVWLGDYDRGLCWFAESDKNWHNAVPAARIEVTNTEQENVLRLHLVDSPLALDQPLEFEFGVQATPVKPYPRALREWSFNLNNWWSKGANYPEPQPLEEGFSPKWWPLTEAQCQPHNKHMQLLWTAVGYYTKCFWTGKVNPDYFVFYDEWKTDPEDQVETRFPHNTWKGAYDCTWVCTRSSYSDYFVWKLAKVIKDYHLTGLYTDGCGSVCRNPAHGCGLMDRDGRRQAESRIFASREVLKRIYVLLREQSPEQTYWVNTANSILPPLYTFNDYYLDGEYCNTGKMRVTDRYTKVLAPERIAAEYMGSQWGVAQYMLVVLSGDYAKLPGPWRDLWALIMPHDVQTMGGLPTAIMREFGAGEATFVGYWRLDRLIQADDRDIYLSYYVHDRIRKALVVASNLTEDLKRIEIRADATALWPGVEGIVIRDFETKRELPLDANGRSARMWVKPHNLRLLEIVPQAVNPVEPTIGGEG